MKEEWADCQTNIPMHVEFMTKRMNIPKQLFQHKIATYEDILATDQPLPDDLHKYECIGGVDYAELRDFCSVGLLFKRQGKRYWIHHTFIWHQALKMQDINQDIIDIGVEKDSSPSSMIKKLSLNVLSIGFRKSENIRH